MPPDSEPGPVYTAGAIFPLQQRPLPITISGNVYEDLNLNNQFDSGEPGIGGVTLTLLRSVNNDYVSTGMTTVTDASGHYSFTDVLPDTYRIVETQPDGYLSVGASAGTVGGDTRGVVTTVDVLSSINLEGGDDSINNNFGETLPASISGYVYYDANDNGVFDSAETGISGATVALLDAQGNPTGSTTVTDINGYYKFENLMPGTYSLAENQPDGYLDGKDAAGTAGGIVSNPDADLIERHSAGRRSKREKLRLRRIAPRKHQRKSFVDSEQQQPVRFGRAAFGRCNHIFARSVENPHRRYANRSKRRIFLHRPARRACTAWKKCSRPDISKAAITSDRSAAASTAWTALSTSRSARA